MKSLWIALVAGTMLWTAGAADARPDTRTMTCTETQALFQGRHAAVLTTGPNTYDRFVSQFGNECDWPDVPMSVAATRDGPCRVYRCEEPVFDFPG
ncbi:MULTISPECIES: hypothetical protein [unclassified Mesorhizobium]|uniref:hypothetical protein n=1 Tax=unclassified Mesorhizobium TaxID=325217 RepID=UPI000FCA65FC|nr:MULTISPECIES: hypothetical protein [unclassified Mesorhizobium]TGP27232.1 hypothetical protein EN874_006310 [Mesorhizobium sp. M1D.F.Ca.ET.231.01.1.1]TGP39190.1 hypothetical protein EN877_06310 [Mesorhizobium sp. M1D.F.Ca.ET.234.01.1.1]TGS51399.1 hypothetical protein EN827_06310 [Mesorhizobium sp. M1D.F.Ca.ET.184.01.1.1]TGS67283.1 hypothetical protein EN826_006310 [Mesorhizobium sp. M1D.F.Ca.ET.183.01.1.1]